MTNLSRRKPFHNVAPHPTPRQMITLAATAQHRPPQITHCLVKSAQRRAVHRHPVVAEVTHQDRAQIRALFPNGRVHASPQLLVQGSQLGLPSLSHRLSQYREVSLPSFPATMRKTQEVERLRFAAAKLLSILFRKAAELDNARFVGMQLKAKPREPLAQFRQKPLCFVAMLEARDESSRPGEFHPQALTDPDLNVSAHPALIVQSAHDATMANEQTAVGLSRQSCKPIALPCADVVSGVCISPSPRRPSPGPDSAMSDKVPICSSDHST